MEPAARSPALPWAAGAAEEAHEEAAGAGAPVRAAEQSLTLEQVGLDIGSRLEVMWKIDKDDGTSNVRWWGAAVASKAESSNEVGPAYVLRYDAFEDFDEELVTVAFMGEHVLQSQAAAAEEAEDGAADEDEELLHWRKEGEEWAPSEEDKTYSLQEVLGRLPNEQTLQADEAAALAELDPSQQRHVVEGFRGFIDNFKAFLAAKVDSAKESGSENLTITKDVIEDFHAQMRTKRQRTNYGTGGNL